MFELNIGEANLLKCDELIFLIKIYLFETNFYKRKKMWPHILFVLCSSQMPVLYQ